MIKGNHIYLRALEPCDVDALFVWENSMENWRYGNTVTPFSKHLLEQYVASVDDIYTTRQLRLMICLKESDEAIGCIDLFEYEPKHQRAGIGVLIGKSDYLGKGHASDALGTMIRYGFETLSLHQLYCHVTEDNDRSLRLFKKHGFLASGTRKEWTRVGKVWLDEHCLQLLNQED